MPRRLSHKSCPECGGKVPWKQWRRRWSARWPCERCGTNLRFDAKRYLYSLVILVGGPFALTLLVDVSFGLTLLFLVPVVFYYDRYFGDRVVVDIESDKNFCSECGYSLRGNPAAQTCPECGTPVTRAKQADPQSHEGALKTLPPRT